MSFTIMLLMAALSFTLVGVYLHPKKALFFLDEDKRDKKHALLIVGTPLFLLFYIFMFSAEEESNSLSKDSTDNPVQEVQEVAEEIDEEIDEEINPEILDVNYLKIWRNYDEEKYNGRYLRYSGPVDYVGENSLNIREGLEGITGLMYLTFDEKNSPQLKNVKKGDYVTVTGLVSSKLAGQISISKGNIEDVGELPQKLYESDKENQKETVKVEQETKIEEEKQSMLDFKNNVSVVTYEELVRNPHKYKGVPLMVQIDVTQIFEGGIITQSGYSGSKGEDQWYVNYELPENSTRILEGDVVNFYGTFDEVVEMELLLFKSSVYLPKLDAMYYEIVN